LGKSKGNSKSKNHGVKTERAKPLGRESAGTLERDEKAMKICAKKKESQH